MARARHLPSRRFAPRHPLLDGEVRDHLAVLVTHADRNRLRSIFIIHRLSFHDDLLLYVNRVWRLTCRPTSPVIGVDLVLQRPGAPIDGPGLAHHRPSSRRRSRT
jgi:hypothetical protein